MTRFQHALKVVLGHEGGYVNDKADRGGATNFGVTTSTYHAYLLERNRPLKPVAEITQAEVEDIYSNYWRDAHCSYLVEPLDLLVFDSAINHGPNRAIKLLQRALGVDEDGICGRNTLAALHEEVVAVGVESVCQQYLNEREAFYDRIIERDPTQAKFARGWGNRVEHLREMV